MPNIIVVLFTIVLLGHLIQSRQWRIGGSARPPAGIEPSLDQAEVELMRENPQAAARHLDVAAAAVRKLRGHAAMALRARFELLVADLAMFADERVRGLAQIELARSFIAQIREPGAVESLETRADALELMIASADGLSESQIAMAHRAFERSAATAAPEVLMRLSFAMLDVGRVLHQRGDWAQARTFFERCIAGASRLDGPTEFPVPSHWDAAERERFWTFGRRAASAAALELAEVDRTTGAMEEAGRWYALSVSLLDGGMLPTARTARAHAWLLRGSREPVDAMSGDSLRLERLGRAIEEGSAADRPDGWVVVAQAELGVASIHEEMGDREAQGLHLERAVEAAERAGEPGHVLGTQAAYLSACHHDRMGAPGPAGTAWRKAYEHGRVHEDQELRRIAFLSGTNLHRLLLDGGDPVAAAALLEPLALLVPSLEPVSRTTAAALLARARGEQLARTKHVGKAIAQFEDAVRIAQGLEPGGESGLLRHQFELSLGVALAEAGRLADAERHFGLALAVLPVDAAVERARILLQRARARAALERIPEAIADLKLSFDCGRDAATNVGREIAAMASLGLGDLSLDDPDARRKQYERAARLGELSGREQGCAVAEQAKARLREMAD